MDPVISRIHRDAAAGNDQIPVTVDSVALRVDGDVSALLIEIAVLIFCEDAVISRCYAERGVFDAETVIDMDPVHGRVDRDRPARDDKIIIRLDAMFISGMNLKGAASVDCQVIMGEYHTVSPVFERFI